jgi:hypothetical protein
MQIRNRLISGNACYHSVQNILSFRLLCKNFGVKIYKTTFLPVVLYGCETWSLTLRGEHRPRMFEKRVLWRMLDVRGRKCVSPSIIRAIKSRIGWARHVAHMGEVVDAHKSLAGKSEGKRPLGRRKRRGRKILEWIFGKQGGNVCTGFLWFSDYSLSQGLCSLDLVLYHSHVSVNGIVSICDWQFHNPVSGN